MEFYGASNDDYDHETVQDINTESPIIKIFGVHAILTKPLSYSVLNIVLLVSIGVLFTFLSAEAIITVYSPEIDRGSKIIALQFMALVFCVLGLSSIKLTYIHQLDRAMKLLKNGIFSYADNWQDEELSNFTKKRVGQIRFFCHAISIIYYLSIFTTSFQSPITQYLLQDSTNLNAEINPYIPIPIYMPFDTTNLPNYIITFISETMFYFILYNTIISYISTYMGATLQLVAQIEILNHSLKNIEKRAFSKLKLDNGLKIEFVPNVWFENQEFQKCLYFCIRENIRHHHEILRYADEIKTYLEPINTMLIAIFSLLFALSIVPALENPIKNSNMILFVVGESFGYFQVAWLGQLVIDVSSETFLALYSTPWYMANKQFNALLNVMQSNIREPLVLQSQLIKTTASFGTYADMIVFGYKLVNVILKKS